MKLIEFVRWVIENSAFAYDNIDGVQAQKKALALGILEEVPFDPEKHGGGIDLVSDGLLAPGDPWFVFSSEFLRAERQQSGPHIDSLPKESNEPSEPHTQIKEDR